MGTRPPLKHYPIIDLVCDQTSGRIYTLSKNWMLEIWDIEQDASLPITRISICSADPEKEYIKQTFCESLPKYLNLFE